LYDENENELWCKDGDIEGDNMYFEVAWDQAGVQFVKFADYRVYEGQDANDDPIYTHVQVDYATYPDYFKVNGADARVYKVKN
jgi:hypothetical protein